MHLLFSILGNLGSNPTLIYNLFNYLRKILLNSTASDQHECGKAKNKAYAQFTDGVEGKVREREMYVCVRLWSG